MVTLYSLAKSINISHGALFVHFKTREELILSVVEKFGDRLASELGRRFMDDMKLKDLLQAHLEVLSEFEDFYLRLISESQSLPLKIRLCLIKGSRSKSCSVGNLQNRRQPLWVGYAPSVITSLLR